MATAIFIGCLFIASAIDEGSVEIVKWQAGLICLFFMAYDIAQLNRK